MLARVAVTGATGWIGAHLLDALSSRGIPAIALSRTETVARSDSEFVAWHTVREDFEGIEDTLPDGIAAIVHLAARVHRMQETSTDALEQYRRTNRDATLRLARAARDKGVSRFIFMSSIKALGEIEPGHPWRESDPPAPTDAYGISKLESEHGLMALAGASFQPTIVRVPLVYGKGVRANFAQLVQAVARGVPLPLGEARALRSFVAIDNLLDAVMACLDDVRAKGETFHVADAEAVSVRDLILAIGVAVHRRPRLFPMPVRWLERAGKLTGREDQVMRLTNPLRVDIGHIASILGWRPKVSLEEGLAMAFKPA